MRIDKYLKVSRLIKRRTIAKEIAEAGRVDKNGRQVKPSDEVKVGDLITLRLGGRVIEVRVISLNDKPVKGTLEPMYELLAKPESAR
ncbi:MAG TPA: RNA-binding S4 domain-containing protein [Bacilli bacterium]|jgi:ribosomal 50S subunit-recycling heat shock protein|nr:RNA-binding S4 domain-containing protein [Bacilli bacterium]